MNKPLLVLNASAGSGKTYNLVRNYLRLLLSEGDDRVEVGQILAMTFTNKASIEMKNRIMSDLNKLANGGDQRYLSEISTLCGLKPADTQKNARKVLRKILHQYEDFNVMTIDKFNLRLIRSFAKDLDLPDNFEISLDDAQVLEKAVDELLDTIDYKNQQKIYPLAINFAKENLEEESNWNIKTVLLEKAKILTNEKLFQLVKSLTKKDFSKEQHALWKLQYKAEKEQLQDWLRKLNTCFQNTECNPDLFDGKSTTFNGILKNLELKADPHLFLKDHKFSEAHINNIEKTYEKGKETVFTAEYLKFIRYFKEKESTWVLLNFKVTQFNILAILKELAISMEDIRSKESIIRVSEFNKLVADLVQNEEAPFIYERLGARFNHYFLDEFQDTSRLQWLNMVPLVHNSLAENKFNFIVGDPKQSIYRFKNGVAEQFVALPAIYNPENDPNTAQKSEFFNEMGKKEGLAENWRSAKNIVEFNNQLFSDFIKFIPESAKNHYENVAQISKGKEGGYIELYLDMEKERVYHLDTILLKWVKQVLDDGYKPADICILGLKKKQCNHYANLLKRNGYQVVSSDSLLVNSDKMVQAAIQFCKWKINRFDNQRVMQFANSYFSLLFQESAFEKYQLCFEINPQTGRSDFSENKFLESTSFTAEFMNSSFQNIYTLLVDFLGIMKWDPIENSYLQQLLDIAYQFDLKNGPDLLEFLQYYDQKAESFSVVLTENEHAIQIMTAHKSKGLEFPVVIIPNLNFKHPKNTKDQTLLEIDDVIIETALTKKETVIPEIAQEALFEDEARYMDSLNLLYVAFTRAQDRLYAMQISGKSDGFIKEITQIIQTRYPETKSTIPIHLKLGSNPEISEKKESETQLFKPDSVSEFLWFPEISLQPSKEQEEDSLTTAQRIGKQFHYIMEQCVSKQTALEAFKIGLVKGIIELEFEEILTKLLNEAFDNTQLNQLFNQGKHLNERTLIAGIQSHFRPDKLIVSDNETIVIDFKTGERIPKHEKQVLSYVQLLREMEMPSIKGYLYYTGGLGLVEVC